VRRLPLSELIKWFEKRREAKALSMIQHHLALTTSIVEDLEKAISALVKDNAEEMSTCIERVANNEREADALRRRVMDEISKGDLSPTAREDIMHLVKRVDMVADWSREAARILSVLPVEELPKTVKGEALKMVLGVKECVLLLRECVNKMMTKPEEALQAADAVEREEERVDDLHEKARRLLGEEKLPKAGIAVLVSQLFEALEMVADSCEDACDHVRVIMVRR
jgi:predicted phosphate transport protein (TIGR00153 family)